MNLANLPAPRFTAQEFTTWWNQSQIHGDGYYDLVIEETERPDLYLESGQALQCGAVYRNIMAQYTTADAYRAVYNWERIEPCVYPGECESCEE